MNKTVTGASRAKPVRYCSKKYRSNVLPYAPKGEFVCTRAHYGTTHAFMMFTNTLMDIVACARSSSGSRAIGLRKSSFGRDFSRTGESL